MNREIILIGPMRTGKSTLGRLLSDKLKIKRAPLDTHISGYLIEFGYNPERFNKLISLAKESAAINYQRKFYLQAIEKHLYEHRNCVIDFGAGHSVYRNKKQLEAMKKILEPYKNVILILPSQNIEESSLLLKERIQHRNFGMEMNEIFLRHKSNYLLAKHIVFTKGQTPEETMGEIIEKIGLAKKCR